MDVWHDARFADALSLILLLQLLLSPLCLLVLLLPDDATDRGSVDVLCGGRCLSLNVCLERRSLLLGSIQVICQMLYLPLIHRDLHAVLR